MQTNLDWKVNRASRRTPEGVDAKNQGRSHHSGNPVVAFMGRLVDSVFYFLLVPILMILGMVLFYAFGTSLLLGSVLAVFAAGVLALWILNGRNKG